MRENNDILADLDILEDSNENSLNTKNDVFIIESGEQNENTEEAIEDFQAQESEEKKSSIKKYLEKTIDGIIFFIKYIATSVGIFAVLLLVSNYSAYWNIVYSIIYAQDMENTQNNLIESVAAANISEEKKEEKEVDTFKQLWKKEEIETQYTQSIHSIQRLTKKTSENNINLGIEITPYENRIVIPKIGKNVPLIDIIQKQVDGIDELNNIFMKELEDGVVRYPGTAKPWEKWNAFIFGHSSNFPWVDGDYNEVFALLDNVVFNDDVIVYYNQKKYTYKIRKKSIIKPGDVSVLKKNVQGGSKITLMTCWPIWTTLNRLILIGELVDVQ